MYYSVGIFGYLMELDSQGSKVNKGYTMEVISNEMIIDISLVLAFFIFGMSVVEWRNKQDN